MPNAKPAVLRGGVTANRYVTSDPLLLPRVEAYARGGDGDVGGATMRTPATRYSFGLTRALLSVIAFRSNTLEFVNFKNGRGYKSLLRSSPEA